MDFDLSRMQQYLEWLKQKVYYDWKSVNTNSGKRKVKRGQVYYCDLGRGIGSEQEKNRPCLIIQNDVGNINSPNTIVAPITSEPGEPKVTVPIVGHYPYFDEEEKTNKALTGNILLANIVTVSKSRLGQHVTMLKTEMAEVDEKILVSLDLFSKFKTLKDAKTKDREFIKKITAENRIMKEILDEIQNILGVASHQEIIEKIAISLDNGE